MAAAQSRASLEAAGHRMLGHHLPRDRTYGSVPPPAPRAPPPTTSSTRSSPLRRDLCAQIVTDPYFTPRRVGFPKRAKCSPALEMGYLCANLKWPAQRVLAALIIIKRTRLDLINTCAAIITAALLIFGVYVRGDAGARTLGHVPNYGRARAGARGFKF
ncbi:hypothetical protein ACJJTC_006798 [Scirpophaga incertulas]